MTMTLEQVRDDLREMATGSITEEGMILWCGNLADAIDAHLTQPAQSVDVQNLSDALRLLEEYAMAGVTLGTDDAARLQATTHALSREKAGPVDGWQPIETAPKGKPVLVHYTNELGKGRTIKARYVERFTEESSPDSENDEYNEADDTYYTLPGWYEMIDNWDEYSSVFVHHDPIHWMPLPASPTPDKEADL